ncbi:hypothetical protein [Exiguobacterium sp. S3]|uniref:hypothetical protein n=1 Tax=Exiguobacterium sp. S3 TaxID=483245 RepID=UPI001BEAF658|nr:hypothetical protein [Exiguobacterium sp. S3]
MNFLIAILGGIVLISNLYIMNFKESTEGNDERGELIKLKTVNLMYNILYISIASVLILIGLSFISLDAGVKIMFAVFLLDSVAGAVYLYNIKK